jgi:hypothetical protein
MAYNFQASAVFSGTDQMSAAVKKMQTNTTAAAGKMGKDLDNTAKRADALKSKIGGIGDIAKGVAIGNLIAKGVTMATGAIKNLVLSVDEFVQRADNVRMSAMKIGLSAEGFQKLAHAADSAGVSADKLQAGFNALNKNLGQYAIGGGTLYKYLSEHTAGYMEQLAGVKSNTEAFYILGKAIADESDIAARAALGNAAFGKSWAELAPLFIQGAEGLRKIADSEKMLSALNVNLESGGLVKYLENTDKALLSQIKSAKTSKDALYSLADAVKKETDAVKKSKLLTAAFGKDAANYAELLTQGAEGLKKAEFQIPNLISDRQIAAAKLWNSTLGEVKKNIQGFGDVMRNAVINAAGPYLITLRDWINKNREFLKQRIAEAVQKAVIFIKQAVIEVQKAVRFFQQWGKTLLTLGGAVVTIIAIAKAINGIKIVLDGARAAMILFSGASAAAGVSAAGAGASAAASAGAFKNLALSINASKLATLGLVGVAIAGATAAWKVAEWGNKKLQKIDPAVPGMGNYYNLHYGARRKAWEKYEAEHPDEPTYAQRIEAAKNPAKEADDPMKELWEKMFAEMEEANAKWEKMLEEMEEQNKKMDEQTGAINGLADNGSDTSPARLRWGNMGEMDFYEIMRLGV